MKRLATFGKETPLGSVEPPNAANLARGPQHAAEVAGKLLAKGCETIVTRKSICLPA
jgi:hypothetical protein